MNSTVVDAPQSMTTSTTKSSNQATLRTRVLLVEDNPTDVHLVRSALADLRDRELFGPVFHIHCAERLSAATACLAEKEFDVVLLDLSLPDSPGLEQTFARVHCHSPHLPVIVLTGLGDEALGLKIVREGAQDYLIKARMDRHLLVKAIRYAIERKRAEQALRESEEKFRSIVETTSEWIWSIDLESNLNYSNPAVETILGYKPAELLGKANIQLIHRDDRRKFEAQLKQAILHKRGWSGLLLRWRHLDGSCRWLESNSVPLLGINGELLGFRGSDRDITERERGKEARAQLQLRLVTVQEEERHRIARELHDQMGQSLAALMLGLKSLVTCDELKSSARTRVQRLYDLVNDLARNVHHLALDLRPTALDDLGLQVALSNYLEEWSARWAISADFHSRGFDHDRIPSYLETTIYRIVQEALTNILRHARAQNISVILEHREHHVLAIIEDDGCGFDADLMMKMPVRERRLGLLGMQERVALVGGNLTIESAPGSGTSLYVLIPSSPRSNGGSCPWTNYAFS